jgi:hypothetical protein
MTESGNPVVKLRAVIQGDDLLSSREISVTGRKAWALAALVESGPRGVTPIEHPGPRWSDYVFKLKKDGLAIETRTEGHRGAFEGHHARYVLRTPVRVLETVRQHDERRGRAGQGFKPLSAVANVGGAR